MDPKQLSEFIARNGNVTGQKVNAKKSLREPETITLEFANGATVTYQQAQNDPDTGEELTPFKIVSSDESKPAAAAQKQTTTPNATESVSAPTNQPYIGERKPGATDITWSRNPNYTEGGKKASGQPYKNAQGKWVQPWSDGSLTELPPEAVPFEEKKPATPPQERVNPANPKERQVWNPSANGGQGAWEASGAITTAPAGPPQERDNPNTNQRERWNAEAGTWEPVGGAFSPKKPDPPTMINGKPYRLTADGRYEPVPIAGSGTQAPDINATNAQLGEISTSLRTKAAQLAEKVRATAGSDNPYTLDDYKRDLTTERELAQAQVTELTSIGQEQRLIQTGERNEGQSRRAFASTASTNAFNAVQGGRSASPTAGRDRYESIRNYQGLQKQFAESIPGTFPDVSRTPMQQEIMSIGMNADGSVTLRPNGGGAGGAQGPGVQMPDLNSIGQQFGATPGMGMGAGTSLDSVAPNLTRPGFSEGQTPAFQYDPFDGDEPLGAGSGLEDAISSAWSNYGSA